MIDHRGKMDVTLAKHSHARALKIGAGPLEFFDPPNLRGQTEASRSNKFHRLSLRISTYKKSAGAHVMNRWRRSGKCCRAKRDCSSGRAGHDFGPARPEAFVVRRRTRRCICNSLRMHTYTKRGDGGVCGQKQIPRAKCALVMTTWRSGGGIVAWKAEVAPAMISGNVVTLAGHFVILSGASRLLFFRKSRLRDFRKKASRRYAQNDRLPRTAGRLSGVASGVI